MKSDLQIAQEAKLKTITEKYDIICQAFINGRSMFSEMLI